MAIIDLKMKLHGVMKLYTLFRNETMIALTMAHNLYGGCCYLDVLLIGDYIAYGYTVSIAKESPT